MKKFKGILAGVLAVLLVCASAVIYAPVVSYAAGNAYTVTVRLHGSGTGCSVESCTGNTECELADGDSIKLVIGHGQSGMRANAKVKYVYNNDTIIYDTHQVDSTGYEGTYTYQDFKLKFEGAGKTMPTRLGVSYSCEGKSYGVDITVTLTDASPAADTSSAVASVSATGDHTHTWEYGTIVAATEESDGLEGYYCSCGATRETTSVSSIFTILKNRYAQLDKAGKGAVVTLKMGTWSTYTKDFMEHVLAASQRGVTVKLDYSYNKQMYETTIPAGTAMEPVYDYYGPLYIQGLFGAEKLN